MEFIPYKSNETLENKYYQIPQELFESSLYKDKLNSDSKILYAFIIDRLTLSQKNNWIDKENNIYLIFTRQEVQKKLGLSENVIGKDLIFLFNGSQLDYKSQDLVKTLPDMAAITVFDQNNVIGAKNILY